MIQLTTKIRKQAHEFATENCDKTKLHFEKHTSEHKFKIGDKALIANNFYTSKNPKVAPNCEGPTSMASSK
jgi:hypothetical protein